MIGHRGTVYLVGAGPGDPGLITVTGLALLRRADVVLHDRLVAPELLLEVRPEAEVVDVGKSSGAHRVSQEAIHTRLVAEARAGKIVVRLKGGDPFVFGRGFEELSACREASIECVVVPGISSALAGPAAAGIPITHRKLARTFAVVSARAAQDGVTPPPPLDHSALAAIDSLIVMMGREDLRGFLDSLIAAGRDVHVPAACIERATTRHQRVTTATLGTLADAADREGLQAPIITVVGQVAQFAYPYNQSEPNPRIVRGMRQFFVGSASITPLPLAGKRIAVTRPRSRRDQLHRGLIAAGGVPLWVPLLSIKMPILDNDTIHVLRDLGRYDWLVFTSVHGVHGFFGQVRALNIDLRVLADCKIAVVGTQTAVALRKYGFVADLIPSEFTGQKLGNELVERLGKTVVRILCPCSDLATERLPTLMRQFGMNVDTIVVYRTCSLRPSGAARLLLTEGVDAVTFCSPSAVRRFVELELDLGHAVAACIGPTTAKAARQAGWNRVTVGHPHTVKGLIATLIEGFQKPERVP